MSYDIWLTGKLGGEREVHIEEPGNITYNLDPMFALALDGDPQLGVQGGADVVFHRKNPALKRFIGKRAAEAVVALLAALEKMEREPDRFRVLNPENGWGDYEGAVDYIRRFYVACQRYPEATIGGWL